MFRAHVATLTVPVYSPFMGRDVMITPLQFRLLVTLMRRPKGWRQRELAAASGYETPGGVSRSLHLLARLGVVAISITRGRKGQTVAWIRRGVVATGRQVVNVAQRLQQREQKGVYRTDVIGNISVGAILTGLFQGGEAPGQVIR